ncbi:MAG: nucleotide exchange factor GrpE [Balneolaceae bacterium]
MPEWQRVVNENGTSVEGVWMNEEMMDESREQEQELEMEKEQPESPEVNEESAGDNEGLPTELEQLKAENAELKELSLRRMAEMDNMRKRMRKERLQQIEEAKADSIEHFLPVNDDLQRTLKAIDDLELDERARDVIDGVRLVANKLEEALRRYDVVRIDETGVPFNVDLHDALMRRPAGESDVEPNTVLEVLESGYRMGDRTIRFAKVIVSE